MSDLRELERDALRLARRIRQVGRPLTPDEDRAAKRETQKIRERLASAMTDELIVNRPEVVSHGKPGAGLEAHRGLEEARARLERTEGFKTACANCPAAQVTRSALGGIAIHCRVEDTRLTSRQDPQSVLSFCVGDYESCPSWMAEKEAIAAGRQGALAGV